MGSETKGKPGISSAAFAAVATSAVMMFISTGLTPEGSATWIIGLIGAYIMTWATFSMVPDWLLRVRYHVNEGGQP